MRVEVDPNKFDNLAHQPEIIKYVQEDGKAISSTCKSST